MQQGDARRTVRIVFNSGNFCWDTILYALKIDHTIASLMPTPAMPTRHPAVIIPPTRFLDRPQEAALRLS
jgi:hypothetical protein